jgi:hypothetical protein
MLTVQSVMMGPHVQPTLTPATRKIIKKKQKKKITISTYAVTIPAAVIPLFHLFHCNSALTQTPNQTEEIRSILTPPRAFVLIS